MIPPLPLPLPSPLLAMFGAAVPLAQSLAEDAAAPAGPYHYTRPFLQPLPVWNYWPWLLVPLAVAVAVGVAVSQGGRPAGSR